VSAVARRFFQKLSLFGALSSYYYYYSYSSGLLSADSKARSLGYCCDIVLSLAFIVVATVKKDTLKIMLILFDIDPGDRFLNDGTI
jgi:hypothetical protein